jgi:hypothetical protein
VVVSYFKASQAKNTYVKFLPEPGDVLLLESVALELRVHDELDLAEVVVQHLESKKLNILSKIFSNARRIQVKV